MSSHLLDHIQAQGDGRRLCRARIPSALLADPGRIPVETDGFAHIDLTLADSKIVGLDPAGQDVDQGCDLAGAIILPVLADIHTHLDKSYIGRRVTNPDNSLLGAVRATTSDHENWTEDDLWTRADFALRCAYAHGTAYMRSHLDVLGGQSNTVWRTMARLRDEWRGRIELQFVAMAPLGFYLDEGASGFAGRAAEHGALLGGVTVLRNVPAAEMDNKLVDALNALFGYARTHNLDIDLHVDESLDPGATTLLSAAEATERHNWQGRVTCGHCCSLSQMDDKQREAILARCSMAGISLVSLPLVNTWLQDRRTNRTPTRRGIAPLLEARAHGIPIGLASDNCGDPFHPFGDYDLMEVLREGTRTAQLSERSPDWVESVTTVPASLMGADVRLRVACGADFIVFSARSLEEMLTRSQHDRVVFRSGRPLRQPLPSFTELDRVFAGDRAGLQGLR